MESVVRLSIRDFGLPEPEMQVEIRDARGRFLGRVDMLYREWRVIEEYEGDQHRTSTRQIDRDVGRLDDFAAEGYRVVRILGRAFFADRRVWMASIERALTDAGWRR